MTTLVGSSVCAGGGTHGFDGGVVAVAGAGGKFAAAARWNHFDLDSAIGAVFSDVRRVVGERVLIADIFGNLLADVVNVFYVFREVRDAAGGIGNFLQCAHGLFAILFVFVAEKTDGVNHDVGLLNFANSLFQSVAAGIVFAVGHGQQDFLVLVAFFRVVHGADERVIKRRAAARIDAFEGFLQFRNAAREILVEVEIVVVVKIDDERFVLWIASLDERKRCLVHTRALVAHAAAVVNDEAHADGNVLAFEDRKSLLGLIFEHAEVFLLQAVYKSSAVVDHRRVQHDEIDVLFDDCARLLLSRRRGLVVLRRERILARRLRISGENAKSGDRHACENRRGD